MADKTVAILKVPRDKRGNARVELDAPSGEPRGASLTLFLRGFSGARQVSFLPPTPFTGPASFPLTPPDFLGSDTGRAYGQASLLVAQPGDAGADFTLKGRLVLPEVPLTEELEVRFQLPSKGRSGIIDLTWWVDE